jgi:hypothetical protein
LQLSSNLITHNLDGSIFKVRKEEIEKIYILKDKNIKTIITIGGPSSNFSNFMIIQNTQRELNPISDYWTYPGHASK